MQHYGFPTRNDTRIIYMSVATRSLKQRTHEDRKQPQDTRVYIYTHTHTYIYITPGQNTHTHTHTHTHINT